MRLLFLTPLLPGDRSSGGEIVTRALRDGLRSLGIETLVVGYQRAGTPPAPGEVGCGPRFVETSRAPLAAAWSGLGALASGQAYTVGKWVGRRYRNTVRGLLRSRSWNGVVLDHAQSGWLAPALGGVRYATVSHQVEARLYREDAGGGRIGGWVRRREAVKLATLERALARSARSVWTLNPQDSQHFAGLGAADVRTLSIPGDVRAVPGAGAGDGVALLGTWTWQPNLRALTWLVEEVAPLLPASIRIRIAGQGSEGLAARWPRVEGLGYVADGAAFLASAGCIAVPAFSEVGLQVKTLDAIASNRPVVATPAAVRGLADLPPSIAVRSDPADYAAAIVAALAAPVRSDGADWADRRAAAFHRQLGDAVAAAFT